MQRKRGELVPVGEVFSNLDGPVKAIREASPQATFHFNQADQVNRLVTARESDPDLGFMARLMALCSLPRTNPGKRLQYKRVNGPYKLIMVAGADNKLPFGNLPRLLLAWVSTEAVRTQSREIVLGKSFSEFMRALGIYSSGGWNRTRLRNQMDRLQSRGRGTSKKGDHREIDSIENDRASDCLASFDRHIKRAKSGRRSDWNRNSRTEYSVRGLGPSHRR